MIQVFNISIWDIICSLSRVTFFFNFLNYIFVVRYPKDGELLPLLYKEKYFLSNIILKVLISNGLFIFFNIKIPIYLCISTFYYYIINNILRQYFFNKIDLIETFTNLKIIFPPS